MPRRHHSTGGGWPTSRRLDRVATTTVFEVLPSRNFGRRFRHRAKGGTDPPNCYRREQGAIRAGELGSARDGFLGILASQALDGVVHMLAEQTVGTRR